MLKTVAKIKPIKVLHHAPSQIFNQTCSPVFSLVGHLGRKFPILFKRAELLCSGIAAGTGITFVEGAVMRWRRRRSRREWGAEVQSPKQRWEAPENRTNPHTHTVEQQQETGVHNRQELQKVHLSTESSSSLCTVSYLQGGNHYKCFLVYFPSSNRATIEFFLLLIKTRKQFSQTVAFSISSI